MIKNLKKSQINLSKVVSAFQFFNESRLKSTKLKILNRRASRSSSKEREREKLDFNVNPSSNCY